MNQSALIPVFTATIGESSVQTVNARELHQFLEVGKDFSNWIKDRIQKYEFVENQDFVCSPVLASEGRGGQNRIDYHISIGMAKELSMVERNAKGKEARQYFIECERQLLESNRFRVPQTKAEALFLAAEQAKIIEEQEALLEKQSAELQEAQPKVQFYDQVVYKEPLLDKAQLFSLLKTKTGQTFNEQTFLNFLREIGVAHKVNPYRNIGYKRFVPKSEYIDYWFVAQMGEDGHTEWFYRNIIVADLVTIIEQARHTERSMVQSSMIRRNRAYA